MDRPFARWITHLLAVILVTALVSCGSNRSAATDQLTEQYRTTQSNIDVKFKIFHFSDDSTRLYVRLNTKNLLYTRRGGKIATATLKIDIEPIEIAEGSSVELYKKSIQFVDKDKNKEPKILVAHTNLYLPFGADYRLKITIRDMNKEIWQNKVIVAHKKGYSNRQNFIITLPQSQIPLFTDRVKSKETYTLHTNTSAPSKIIGHYYNRYFPLSRVPFSAYEPKSFDYTPDSSFSLTTDSDHLATFTTALSGFYHFQFDPTQKKGFSVFVSSDEFPNVTTVKNMIESFRYLVSSEEFQEILEASNKKAKLEYFWIKWTGTQDRARKAIQEYYQRVEDSNKLFSSYVEGWKSDRGLIYIIYGQPNKAYREGVVETWIYGEENNPLSITFHFIKVINPFTVNDYRLIRQDMYKPSWYRAVNRWRDGRVY